MNVSAWSLSVEAFFYLLFPIAIVFLRRATNKSLWVIRALLLAATGIICVRHLGRHRIERSQRQHVSELVRYLFPGLVGRSSCLVWPWLFLKDAEVSQVSWAAGNGILAMTWAVMTAWPTIYGSPMRSWFHFVPSLFQPRSVT